MPLTGGSRIAVPTRELAAVSECVEDGAVELDVSTGEKVRELLVCGEAVRLLA